METRKNQSILAFQMSAGQFACPSRQLLKGAKGIHFQSEAESMEPSDCEEQPLIRFALLELYFTFHEFETL